MGDAEKYLSRLDALEIKKSKKSGGKFREYYEGVKKWEGGPYYTARQLMGSMQAYRSREDRAMSDTELRALARRTMEKAKEDDYVLGGIYAANIYAELGKPHIGMAKLMAVVEKARREGKASEKDLEEVRHFIKQRLGKRQPGGGGIEGHVSIFILSSVAGIALAISSLTATGNAIGNLTNTTQGMLGIIFFVFGVAGLVFGKR